MLESIAEQILGDVNKTESKFDPLTVLAVIQIIILIVKFIWECQNDKNTILNRLHKPRLVDKRIVKRLIKQCTKKNNFDSDFKANLEEAFYRYSKSMSENDFDLILDEVKKRNNIA